MTRPHKCPVCEGRGVGPWELFAWDQPCHACSGSGVVWERGVKVRPASTDTGPWPWEPGGAWGNAGPPFPPGSVTRKG